MIRLLPLPSCRHVRVAREGPAALITVAEAMHDHARCPTCRAISTLVHSRYQRRRPDFVGQWQGRLAAVRASALLLLRPSPPPLSLH